MCIMYPDLVHTIHYSPCSSFLLQWLMTGFDFPYSYMCRKYINHIYPPLLSSFTLFLLLVHSLQHNLIYIFALHELSGHCSAGFCLGILTVNILQFSQFKPISLPYSIIFLSHYPYCSTVFSVLFIHRCNLFQYYSLYQSLLPLLLPLSPLTVPLLDTCSVYRQINRLIDR
jgi:hypothetical protein